MFGKEAVIREAKRRGRQAEGHDTSVRNSFESLFRFIIASSFQAQAKKLRGGEQHEQG
jgi:hypothetical protein